MSTHHQKGLTPILANLTFYPVSNAAVNQPLSIKANPIKSNQAPHDNHDDMLLTADDIKNLTEQGFDGKTIEAIAQAVNEQLSSNANASDVTYQDNVDKPNTSTIITQETLDKNVHTAVEKRFNDQQEQQYEAFKQFLAKKNSEQTIDYRQVRINIESGALPTRSFYLLNGLAAIIAGFGLLANSPAVVIGAMLVAMLIGPISGIALAIIDARFALLKKSLLTLFSGGVLIYAIGMLLGWLYPEQSMSQEIVARTAPNTMDVVVALAGGTAGAYAMISRNLSVAVVGVAVATALVPPLTASGILLANGNYDLALGALLLTLTNILAIQFTNALVLWVAGFRRLDIDVSEDDRVKNSKWQQSWLFMRRNLVTLIMLVGISIYLTINFQQKIKQQNYEIAVKKIVETTIANQPNYVVSTSFDVADKAKNQVTPIKKDAPYLIRVVLQGLTPPNYSDIAQMEQKIIALSEQQYPNRAPAKLQVRFVPEQVIETTPITKDDVKLDNAALSKIKDNKN